MNFYNLIIGLALLIFGSYYLYYIYINNGKDKETEDFKYNLMYYDVKIAGAVFVFVMIGVVMIYREIKVFL